MFCKRCKTVTTVIRKNPETNEKVQVSLVHKGRLFVDRVYSDNKNYELACLSCGDRKFVGKSSVFGRWLDKKEQLFANASVRSD